MVISYDIRFGPIGKLMHALIMRKKLQASLPETAAAVKIRVESGGVVPAEMGEPTLAT
jgi:hypothetical protein